MYVSPVPSSGEEDRSGCSSDGNQSSSSIDTVAGHMDIIVVKILRDSRIIDNLIQITDPLFPNVSLLYVMHLQWSQMLLNTSGFLTFGTKS